MAICPFAVQRPITGASGVFTTGPFRIIHHTTEGWTAAGAFDAFARGRSDPHFTVDANVVYQHIDTALAARSLKNLQGGVETNKASAIQIELVGFAGAPKDTSALTLVARLCRWLEAVHTIPVTWPNGYPRPSLNGADLGNHNRDVQTWNTAGGHYGHSQTPENTHWDPGYTKAECDFVSTAAFDHNGRLINLHHPSVGVLLQTPVQLHPNSLDFEIMEDHSTVLEE